MQPYEITRGVDKTSPGVVKVKRANCSEWKEASRVREEGRKEWENQIVGGVKLIFNKKEIRAYFFSFLYFDF